MRLIQYVDEANQQHVAAFLGERYQQVNNARSTYQLAQESIKTGITLEEHIVELGLGEDVDFDALRAQRRLLLPFQHPDDHRTTIAITGLTHFGSASSRDKMHESLDNAIEGLTDTMAMLRLGLEGGKPASGESGAQSEWVYKGDGSWAVPPEHDLCIPSFGLDVGDEAEVVGIYLVDDNENIYRVGFTLGTELTDHMMERQNYLWLGHSKLRQCSYGPELLVGELPAHIVGRSRLCRGEKVLWEAEFLTGEDNMSHSLANLEYHHFKYDGFRRPGDAHICFLGASEFSFASGVKLEEGDELIVDASVFGHPLKNRLRTAAPTEVPVVRTLY